MDCTEISQKFMSECKKNMSSGVKTHSIEVERVYRTYKNIKEITDLGVKFRID